MLLRDICTSLSGKVVRFTEAIGEYEGDFDPGMRAKVTRAEIKHDGVTHIEFDFTDFKDANKAFEKANYFDPKGNPTLRWSEMPSYPTDGIVSECFDADSVPPFELADSRLVDRYLAEGKGIPYMEWLETLAAKALDIT